MKFLLTIIISSFFTFGLLAHQEPGPLKTDATPQKVDPPKEEKVSEMKKPEDMTQKTEQVKEPIWFQMGYDGTVYAFFEKSGLLQVREIAKIELPKNHIEKAFEPIAPPEKKIEIAVDLETNKEAQNLGLEGYEKKTEEDFSKPLEEKPYYTDLNPNQKEIIKQEGITL